MGIRTVPTVTSITSSGPSDARQFDSREAAQECSPGRKPWVSGPKKTSPERAKENGADLRQCRGPSDLQYQTA